MDDDQQFCLRWNNHQSTLISVFDTLLENETLVDCTLAAEGRFLKAHKVVLSACSPYFATLLQEQYDKHPIFILKDVKYQELRAMMDYMYRGEVNISQDQLAALLKAAESLQIKGLSDNRTGGSAAVPRPETHHRGKLGAGYTLEQTKRARIAPSAMLDTQQDVSGSREGSSSPSRRRRKARRRSMENDVHENSNSSQQVLQAVAANQSLLQQQTNASLAASALVATQMPISSATTHTSSGANIAATTNANTNQGTTQQQQLQQHQQLTTTTKKTESVKGTSSSAATAIATGTSSDAEQNVQTIVGGGNQTSIVNDEQDIEQQHQQQQQQLHIKTDKQQNHKSQKMNAGKDATTSAAAAAATEMVIEPKSEYDDDVNEETVEDLTLDDEDMGMDDLDHNAGTSQGGEGSSQGYAPWQHDRSQDELLLATQEAQQRDPQDLSRKENTAPLTAAIQRTHQRSILNTNKRDEQRPQLPGHRRKRLSVTEVSDMLFEFYKTKSAKAPKTEQVAQQALNKYGQVSPTSAETHEPSSIAAIATNSAAETASKNLLADEMMPQQQEQHESNIASFHPRIKYTLKPTETVATGIVHPNEIRPDVIMTAIPTSVLVPNISAVQQQQQQQQQHHTIDIKPLIHPTTGLIITPVASASPRTPPPPPPSLSTKVNKTQAAVITEALLRNNLHSFQQQLRAHELMKYHQAPKQQKQKQQHNSTNMMASTVSVSAEDTPTKILENLLMKQQQRDQRHSECENEHESTWDTNEGDDGDDEDDSRLNGFDDIHLMEGNGYKFGNGVLPNMFQPNTSAPAIMDGTDETQKYMMQAKAHALRQLEYSMSDYGGSSNGGATSPNGLGPDGEPIYECRHCGKKYRWKSTLRRHENVECGGKEPSHQCPYCPYKSKQRGNLGVHVRKHHTNLPQLPSKRRSKYSIKLEDGSFGAGSISGNVSDDSQSKLIIDFSK